TVTLFNTLWSFNLHLTLTLTGPLDHDHDHHEDQVHHNANPDRCDGIEFDAIAPLDEKGNTFFFKGDHLWKGFTCPAQVSSDFFKELDDYHHLGHVDAAFHMHNKEKPEDQDHINLFLALKCVMDIKFPSLDVSCLAYVFSLTGEEVYNYDIATESVKERQWAHLPNCTSAFRWLERYNCFYGHNFTRLHSVSGEVNGVYPKDARHYFMTCPNFSKRTMFPKCSEVTLDAITSDDSGKTYAFTGRIYMHLDTHNDGKHAFPIARTWKEVANGVDAVFSYSDKIYIIKGNQVYIYKSAAPSTLIEGYPKSLKRGAGHRSACERSLCLCRSPYCKMQDIDRSATPRIVAREAPLPISGIEAGMCGPDGIKMFVGSEYHHYDTPRLLAFSKFRPDPKKKSPQT
uniref:Hemopexin n=1 Tax=Oncorhynchus tshawytscha TaxID=74940 RepID=A0A8C8GWB5_ONCTS